MEKMKYMNPYLAGFFLGLVLLAAFYFSAEGLGGSGAPKRLVVGAVEAVAPQHAYNNEFYNSYTQNGERNPLSNWVVVQVVGLLAGGFLSGAFSGRLKLVTEHSPKITSKKRLYMALIGGILFGIGSQFGRGCTSGAALSGMAVFSVAGYLTLIAIFGTAFIAGKFVKKLWI